MHWNENPGYLLRIIIILWMYVMKQFHFLFISLREQSHDPKRS